VRLGDGDRFGPLRAIATPGHAADHLAYVAGGVCFSGDAVLGEAATGAVTAVGETRGGRPALASASPLSPELSRLDLSVWKRSAFIFPRR